MFLVSCVPPKIVIYQLNSTCNKPVDEVFKNVTSILLMENLNIDHSDVNIGFILASSTPIKNYNTESSIKGYGLLNLKTGE